MNRFSIVRLVWLFVGLALPARAQVPQPFPDMPPRPYRGVFGGNAANSVGLHHNLDSVLALFGGYDDNLGDRGGTGLADAGAVIGGPYSGGGAGLSYAWRGRRVLIGASASSRTSYYKNVGNFLDATNAGGAGLEATLGARTRLQAQGSFASTPLFTINPFPTLGPPNLGEAVPPNTDMALASVDVRLVSTSAGVSHALTGRSTVGMGYGFSSSRYTLPTQTERSSPIQDLKSQTATGRWDHRLSSRSTASVVYSFNDGYYSFNGVVDPFRTQEAELELERQWIHSRTRRTSARVTLGGTLIDMDEGRVVRPVGGFQLSSLIGQSWDLRLNYRRSVEPIPGLPDLTHLDAIGGSAEGLINRWVDLRLAAAYADGTIGLSGVSNTFNTYGGTARVGVAVHRQAAVFAEFFYYYDSGYLFTATDEDRRQERRGLRAGMSWWLPIIRERQSGDTR